MDRTTRPTHPERPRPPLVARSQRCVRAAALATLAIVRLGGPATTAEPTLAAASVGPGEERVRSGAGELTRPDVVGTQRGGTAARLRTGDGEPVGGELFLLTGRTGAAYRARVFDQTPFDLAPGRRHHDSEVAERDALDAIARLTGMRGRALGLTGASGPGRSAGLVFAIAHLDGWAEGGFSAGVRIAATGEIDADGVVGHVGAIEEKTMAADLAGVDVLFASARPRKSTIATIGARSVGTIVLSTGGETLAEQRGWDRYEEWGATRTPSAIDVVTVRHLGDVAAYLCGTGSVAACAVVDRIADRRGVDAAPSGHRYRPTTDAYPWP